MRRALSFRAKILLVVLAGAVVPLAIVGLWLTRTASMSGDALLQRRLEGALDRLAPEIGGRWIRVRGDLLSFAEDSTRGGPDAVLRALVRDASGAELWRFERGGEDVPGAITVRLALRDPAGRTLGTLEADLRSPALLEGATAAGAAAGAAIGAQDRGSGAWPLSLPFDPMLLERGRFTWGGEEWLGVRRELQEPALMLVAAAPLSPFIQPFKAAARTGALVLGAVAAFSMALATLLTGRLTGTLSRLAGVAEAVSRGDLDQRVVTTSADEVGRVAHAFNAMTESLGRTLRELAQRQSLAAVGEFATRLAHEIRNPLTAIRVDLQRVEEGLPRDAALRAVQARALREVARLDRAVGGALRIARSGSVVLEPLNLRTPLQAAAEAAAPAFAERGAVLEPIPAEPAEVAVRGDGAAIEQVFLNLFLNAAQALEPGGRAWVEVRRDPEHVTVTLTDEGAGIAPEHRDQAFDPFFSTRPGGTGLGLAIARQIVIAHHGEIRMESAVGKGTTVSVVLPSDGSGEPARM
jgi:signal transduction histidine kinase